MHTVYLSLGSNLGDRREQLLCAIAAIGRAVGPVVRQSSFHETAPWGFQSAHPFLNACLRVETALAPRALLRATQEIERALGRTQKSCGGQYHDRPIDIDILLYDDLHLQTPELTIPHPLMHEREFVMAPLREVL